MRWWLRRDVPLGFERVVLVGKRGVGLFEKRLGLLYGLWRVTVLCRRCADRTSGLAGTRWVMRSSTAASCSVCFTAPP